MKHFYIFILLLQPILFWNEASAQEIEGANIILNPSFDSNDAGWSNYFDYFWDPTNPLAAKASVSVVTKAGYSGNAYKVTILNAGTADYSVQISYPVALQAGKKYAVRFKASADSSRAVTLNCQQNAGAKSVWYASAAINLTTGPTVLGPYYFTAPVTDPSNLFKFYLGGGGTANAISAYFDDVSVVEVIEVPGATIPGPPVIGAAIAGSSKATVNFTAPADTGGLSIKSYTVTSTPGGITATGPASPIKIAGLTNGTAYTFTVFATNALGNSLPSAASNAVTPVFAPTVYYVSPGGNDDNDGLSVSSPFATLTKAHATAIPADTIYIRTGTYPPFTISNSGSAFGTITYKAYPGDKPVITCGLDGAWNLLQINASYITIDGLEVKGINDQVTLAQGEANYNKILAAMDAGTSPDYQSTINTNTNGISVNARDAPVTTHVTIKNCKVHDCSAGGLGGTYTDYLTFENNEVYNNSWYTMWATSGISVGYLIGTDSGANTVFRGNKVYNNYCLVKWISIKALSDGNGIIIDVDHPEGTYPGYTGKFLVENNVVYDNGGRGLYIISSQNAVFRNNTSYHNSKSSFSTGGEMVVFDSHDITYVNNIGWANPAYSSENYAIRDDGAWGTNANITWKNNIAFNGTVGNAAVFINKTTTTAIDNTNKLGVDPLLVNPSIVPADANFHLQPSSPAIDAGISAYGVPEFDFDGMARVQGNAVDMGAYESPFLGPLPLTLVNFAAKRTNESTAVITWSTMEEVQVDYFELQKADDNRSFYKIARVISNGRSSSTYDVTDDQLTALITYYRLKIVDKDGGFRYSKVVAVSDNENHNKVGDLHPNPVGSNFTNINIVAEQDGIWSISVVNLAGQKSKLQSAFLVKGPNVLKVNLSAISAGIHFLQIENNGEVFIRKVIKVQQ